MPYFASLLPTPVANRLSRPLLLLLILAGGLNLSGCQVFPSQNTAQAQAPTQDGVDTPAAVETAIAQPGSLEEPLEYTGTTQPIQQVSLRSQAEGRLLNLSVNVGDTVRQGEVLGQLDDRLIMTLMSQAQAELAALQSEVAQAEAEVSDAQAQVEQARVEWQQAETDAERLQSLAQEGVITAQQAEQAVTAALAAEQIFRSAQEQVRTREQAVTAARGRVRAQQAVLAEIQARRAYSLLTAPITGTVLERVTEPGNLVQPGNEVLKLGDFSAIKVVVQVSELELGSLRPGQAVSIRLDAFPDQSFQGQISRISPAADPTARLIPIEITMPNGVGTSGRDIGSGLLARVQFQTNAAKPIVLPESALSLAGEETESTVFVLEGDGEAARVVARSVEVGDRANGQVVIRSGLQSGEPVVIRSSDPLTDGQLVRLSILSETVQ